jgi:F-type H+-transporting ATPase subunit gamma
VATTKDIRKRIGAVEKTQKIVSAMKMMSATKLARAQAAIHAARPYADKLALVLGSVASGVDADAHPLLEVREKVRRLDVLVLTSDRGLCGAFNASVVKRANRVLEERRDELDSVAVIPIGRRGRDAFAKTRLEMPRAWPVFPAASPELATEVASFLAERFRSGEADETVLVFGEFVSALAQRPRADQMLPVRPPPEEEAGGATYEIEPDPERLLAQLVPRAVEFAVFRALLDSQASEHGARMTAMDSATSNTEELIRTLTLDYNKARQASITAEIVEIMSGAEAL